MFDNPYDEPALPGPSPDEAAQEATPGDVPAAPPGAERFKTCRWRCAPDEGTYCTHRDVLPFAGKEGFNAEAWCPDCAFYKVRRTPKKRERSEYGY